MSVKIGHASIDERGKISGGQAGDQTGKEVCIREWYNKPFTVVLRPNDPDIAEKSAKACETVCKASYCGYDQNQRNTLHTEAKKVNYDLTKITTKCETDCSAFMTLCAIAAGVKELEYTGNAPTTSTMVDAFTKTGKYIKLTDPKYLTSDKYLQRGDVLVKPGSHTVMSLENGSGVSASNSNVAESPKTTATLSYPIRVVDVAQYQKNVNYQSFKNSGVQGAVIKIINKNLEKESMFDTHWNGFTGVGLPCSVYAYSYATTVERANLEANAVLKVLDGRKCNMVFYDIEDKVQQGIGARLPQIINAFQKKIEDAGYKFAIYSGLSFVKSYLKPYVSQLNCKDIWFARYYKGDQIMYINSTLDYAYHPSVDGFNTIGWQYSSKGTIPGYSGNLDLSVMYGDVSASTPSKTISNVKYGVVTANVLNIRDKPSTLGKVIGAFKKGDRVAILGTDSTSGWYKLSEGAYASNKYIQIQ